jgi:hypothetical protein
MTEIPEWNTFLEGLQSKFTPPEKTYSLSCINRLETFQTKSLTVRVDKDTSTGTYTATLEYRVLRCDADGALTHEMEGTFEKPTEIFQAFYRLLWNSNVCCECYNMVVLPSTLCSECYPMRIFYQYGMAHQYVPSVPTCSICFDQVYLSKLQCGHYVHKTCLIRMNTERWFSYDTEIKCPICRAALTSQDKYDYFLWLG